MRRRRHHLSDEVFLGKARVVLLTLCTADRRRLFEDGGCAAVAAQEVRRLHGDGRTVFGYCVMPDHVHLLVGTDGEVPGEVVRSFKARVSRQLRAKGVEGGVWQRGYHDRVLRREEGIREALRYMAENPVRAGLVRSWWAYPWTGAPAFPGFGRGFFGPEV